MRQLEETKFAFPLVIGVFLAVAFVAVPAAWADDPKETKVDCDKGQTISDALQKHAGKPITITVAGTCNENVTIARDTVTLQADPAGGTVNGPNSALATITVAGQDVLIDGLRVTGGLNGIDAVGASRVTIQNCTVETTGRNGINFTQGTNGTVDHCTVQSNPRDGVRVGEGSTGIVINNTISLNGRRGVHVFQNGNALIGITNTSPNQPAGNMIMSNGNRGISVSTGSSASIGMNTISGNGTNPANNASNRVGINVNDGSHVNLAGGNMISGNTGGGLQVGNAGATLSDAGFNLPTTVNTITGNLGNGGIFAVNNASLAIADAHVDSNTGSNGITLQTQSVASISNTTVNSNTGNGIALQLQSTASTSNTTVNGNTGNGIVAFNNSSLFIGDSHIDSNTGNGLNVLLRSTAQVANSTVNGNTVGIQLFQGGALSLNFPPAVMVTGNTVFGLSCADGESSYAGNDSGITGNGFGGTQNVSPACTMF